MNKVSELKVMIGQTFSWNKARLDCFVRMLLALFAVRTVNLTGISRQRFKIVVECVSNFQQ